jgi:heterodisulfide reductase subunit B
VSLPLDKYGEGPRNHHGTYFKAPVFHLAAVLGIAAVHSSSEVICEFSILDPK